MMIAVVALSRPCCMTLKLLALLLLLLLLLLLVVEVKVERIIHRIRAMAMEKEGYLQPTWKI